MDDKECSICYSEFKDSDITVLDCKHKFHFRCIFQWSNQSKHCPLCRCDLVIGRNPILPPKVIYRAQNISCFEKCKDRTKCVFGTLIWMTIFWNVVVLIASQSYFYYQNNQNINKLDEAIKNGDVSKARESLRDITRDSGVRQALENAIRFNQFEIVKMIVNEYQYNKDVFNYKIMEYATYHKNEIITNYIRSKHQENKKNQWKR